MQVFRRLLRRIAVFASMFMLAGALLPTLALATGTGNTTGWAEVCSAQGMKWVIDAEASHGDAPVTPGPLDHCPFCSLGQHGAAPPPSACAFRLPLAEGTERPERFYSAARTPHVWCTAQPRAPPTGS